MNATLTDQALDFDLCLFINSEVLVRNHYKINMPVCEMIE